MGALGRWPPTSPPSPTFPGSAGRGIDMQDTRLDPTWGGWASISPPPSRLPTRQRGSFQERIPPPPATRTQAQPPFYRGGGAQQGGGAGYQSPLAHPGGAGGRQGRPSWPSGGRGRDGAGGWTRPEKPEGICRRLPPLRGPPGTSRSRPVTGREAGEGTSGAGSARRGGGWGS